MKKYLAFILAMLLLLAFSASAFASEPIGMIEEETIEYPFTEPYEYPIVPGTDEWAELDSLSEMIDACHVPQMALDNMTTEASLETVFNYPLLGNIFAYDSAQKGFEKVRCYCNGLQELWFRTDLVQILENLLSTDSFEEDYNIAQRTLVTVLLDNLQGSIAASPMFLNYTLVDRNTPRGSWVIFYGNMTWQDHGLTEEEAEEQCEMLHDPYVDRGAIVVSGGVDPSYNCHSYTFYLASTSNNLWLDGDEAEIYITDGSYNLVTDGAEAGDKAWYGVDHSGIVRRVQNGRVYVRSKWGFGGIYEHDSAICPYEVEDGIGYYRLDD
ncbi:MAG: hypothetical protein Q4B50_07885 [Bacillota bacterium]|nr:hypothetical protein [Bacillota bacterium]